MHYVDISDVRPSADDYGDSTLDGSNVDINNSIGTMENG